MKIHLVNMEDGIMATGFRKMASVIRRINPDTRVSFVSTRTRKNVRTYVLNRSLGSVQVPDPEVIDEIACSLADSDLIGFSSMSGYAPFTRAVIKRVREISSRPFLIWGGIHPIIHPEDAIKSGVDAICTGEGEFAFREFWEHFSSGRDYRRINNFWFNSNGQCIKNPFRPLMTGIEMESLPFPHYGENEWIYRRHLGFVPLTMTDYLEQQALSYSAIWSIGCPFHCTFCGNTAFIANDKNYKKIRHPSAQYIVDEIQSVRRKHPYLSQVTFNDDSFLAIPLKEIEEFSQLWRVKVKLPFLITGVIPNYVTREKIEVLTWAGMSQVRMGIQSGSKTILDFYKRPTPIEKIETAATVLSSYSKYHLPPMYDIIVDNPVETESDIAQTLNLVQRLARPFFLNIYSLRVIPNTEIERELKARNLKVPYIEEGYLNIGGSLSNALLYLLSVWKPPKWVFEKMLKQVRFRNKSAFSPFFLMAFRSLAFVVRGLHHLRVGDFSLFWGKPGFVIWKIGILEIWQRRFTQKFKLGLAVNGT